MNRFTLPRDIYYGKGSMEVLKNLNRKEGYHCIGRRFHEALWFRGQGSCLSEGSRN